MSTEFGSPKDPKRKHPKINQNLFYDSNRMFKKDDLEIILSCINNEDFMKALKENKIYKIEKGCTLTLPNGKSVKLAHSLNFDSTFKHCFTHHPGKDFLLGKGTFGKVKIVQDIRTGELGANKVLNIVDDYDLITVHEEQKLMQEFEDSAKHSLRERRTAEKNIKTKEGISLHMPAKALKSIAHIDYKGNIFQPLYAVTLWDFPYKSYINKIDMAMSIVKDYEERFYKKDRLHRDIKGGNIMAPDQDLPKGRLIDFGTHINLNIALDEGFSETIRDGIRFITPSNGRVVTTYEYAAPEIMKALYRSKELPEYSDRSDVYALGKVLGNGWIKDMHLEKLPDDKGIPEKIVNAVQLIVEKMTEKEPSDRPNITEVHKALFGVRLDLAYYQINRIQINDNTNLDLDDIAEWGEMVIDNQCQLIEMAFGEEFEDGFDNDIVPLDPRFLVIEGYEEALIKKLDARGVLTEEQMKTIKQAIINKKEVLISPESQESPKSPKSPESAEVTKDQKISNEQNLQKTHLLQFQMKKSHSIDSKEKEKPKFSPK